MTKSRTLPALLLLASIGPVFPAAAQAGLPRDLPPLPQTGTPEAPTMVSADEAIAIDQARMRDFLSVDCPPGRFGEDEVIVCGRRTGIQRYRVPMAERDLGRGSRDRAGAAQLDAMAANSQPCSPVGRDKMCGGGIDIFAIGFTIIRGIRQALANRD